MVKLTIETIDNRTVVTEFGHGRDAIVAAEREAERVSANRWVRSATVTGKLDF
jgi:hypothetical protein